MTQTTNKSIRAQSGFTPTVKELTPAPLVSTALRCLQDLPGCLLLDSSMRIPSTGNAQPLGRYSFLMADPFESIEVAPDHAHPLDEIARLLDQFQTTRIADLPPMQGGVAGLFSYDLNRSFANIPTAENDELAIPAIVVGAYDTVIAWDHEQNRAWIISQGFPETEALPRSARAQSRIKFFASKLESSPPIQVFDKVNDTDAPPSYSRRSMAAPIERLPGLFSNFSKADYIATVQRCIDYIYAGDVFQINLAQQLAYPANCDSIELYFRLCACNPSPFGGYFDLSRISDCDAQIVTASPERLCSVRDRVVETRPIKGTRKRTGRPMVDIQARQELLSSVKDRAENTMIVDLMRNDLSMICDPDSVLVTQYCELEEYQSVMHLVSSVHGKLKNEHGLVDLLQSIFPGGSITGAPKVRAMEIIAELEPSARGAYCGALGYLGFDGSADLNILIRTITASHGWWQIPVGGGIVSQSNPEHEYDETWTKAAGMLRAMTMDSSDLGVRL